jgi:hypothetical protein
MKAIFLFAVFFATAAKANNTACKTMLESQIQGDGRFGETIWTLNTVAGSTKFLAACELVGRPNVTACVAMAEPKSESNRQNGPYVAFRISAPGNQELNHVQHTFFTDRATTSVGRNYIEATDIQAKGFFDRPDHDGQAFGLKHYLTVDLSNGTARYEVYSSRNTQKLLPFSVKWEENLGLDFRCKRL